MKALSTVGGTVIPSQEGLVCTKEVGGCQSGYKAINSVPFQFLTIVSQLSSSFFPLVMKQKPFVYPEFIPEKNMSFRNGLHRQSSCFSLVQKQCIQSNN